MKHALRMAAGVLVIVAFAAGQARAANPHGGSTASSQACGDAGTVAMNGKARLWPPNHKMSPYTFAYSGGTEGETFATHASSSAADPTSGVSPVDASAVADAEGNATTTHSLRAERAGTDKTGRTYTIAFSVTGSDSSEVCSGSFTVVAPHDNRGKKH